MVKKFCFAGIVLVALAAVPASADKVGTTGASFLKLGVGARALGMGECFVAIADDVTTAYWNPAGLASLEGPQLTATHAEWLQEIRYEHIGYAQALGSGVAGISVTGLYLTGIEKRSQTMEDLGTFGAYDIVVSLSWATEVSENLLAGASGKLIHQNIDDVTAWSGALDLGALYETGMEGLTLGLAIQNLGPAIKFIDGADPLPINFKLGGAYRLLDEALTIGLDINQPIETKTRIHVGAEFWYANLIAARAGYRYKIGGNDLGALSGLTAGIGFKLYQIEIDYALVPYGDLGLTHRITLILSL